MRRNGCKPCKRISRSKPQPLVPPQELAEVKRDEISHQLVRLIPVPDFGDAILQDRVCLRDLRRDFACRQIRRDLRLDVGGFQLGIVGLDQSLDDRAANKRKDRYPHFSLPSEATAAARRWSRWKHTTESARLFWRRQWPSRFDPLGLDHQGHPRSYRWPASLRRRRRGNNSTQWSGS